MSFKDRSIQYKISWVIMFTTVTSLIIAGVVLLFFDIRDAERKLGRELSSIAQIVAANSVAALEFDDPKAGTSNLSALDRDRRVAAAALYRENGEVFATYLRGEEPSVKIPDRPQKNGVVYSEGYLKLFFPVTVSGRRVGTLFIQATASQIAERVQDYAAVLGLVILCSSFIAYLLSFRLRQLISRPIVKLAETALTVSRKNDYTLRAEKEGNDEIGLLIDRFNDMLGQIRTQNSALKESEHQLRLIADSLPVLISYVDTDERYRFNNAPYEQWFQISLSELHRKKVSEIGDSESYAAMAPHIQAALRGEPQRFEHVLRSSDGAEHFVRSSYIPDFSERGDVRGFFALLTDITDRKKAEDELKQLNEALEQRVLERTRALKESQEQLRHSERLASIGTLAAGIAHEINNPINSILLAAQYALRYSGAGDEKTRETFGTIKEEAQRCGKIIKSVLQFAKAEKTKKWPHDLNQVVRHAVDLAKNYIHADRLQVALDLSERIPPAVLNPTEIEQVIINLIKNATEAASGGVNVTIATSQVDDGLRITVTDDGPGISDEVLKHIFDPFYSTRRERGGTGLGLSIAHGIIADHGGSLSVNSMLGEGTEFVIDLRIAESGQWN
ncbi:MAG: ATP-binding protein [Bdellovibrionota bacterium]